MKNVKIRGNYFSASAEDVVKTYLEEMGLTPVNGGYNNPHASLGYKEKKPALYSPKKYADGWGIFVQYYYEGTIMRQQNRRIPHDEFLAIFGRLQGNIVQCKTGMW